MNDSFPRIAGSRVRWGRMAILIVTLALAWMTLEELPARGQEAGSSNPSEPVVGHFEVRLVADEPREGWIEMISPRPGESVFVAPEAAITHNDVERAWLDDSTPEAAVGLLLTEEGMLDLALFTRQHVGERIAFIVDGRIVSMPHIAAEITGGRALIQGNFSEAQARELVAALNRQ